MRVQIVISFFLLLFSSCTSLSNLGIEGYENEELSKNNYEKLNGMFSIISDTVSGAWEHSPGNGYSEEEWLNRMDILDQLYINFPYHAFRTEDNTWIKSDEKWVKIEFISKNKALISLFHNEKCVISKKIRGRFKNNYFYLRPKIWAIPLIPILFGYNFERARIGISSDCLIIDHSENSWGFIIAAGGSDKGYVSAVYKRKN